MVYVFNDLGFYKEMLIYKKFDNDVAALETFNRHLWYLTEEISPLSIFSNKVSDHDKAKITKTIL